MVGLSLALLPIARPKSKSTALFKLSGSSQPFNLSDRTRSLIVFLVSYDCKCSLVVPHSALDLAAVCDCGIP